MFTSIKITLTVCNPTLVPSLKPSDHSDDRISYIPILFPVPNYTPSTVKFQNEDNLDTYKNITMNEN